MVYSSNGNKDLHIGRLSRDYTDVVGDYRKAIVGDSREAPALFRHADRYYMATSGCTGWDANKALIHTARYAEPLPPCDTLLIKSSGVRILMTSHYTAWANTRPNHVQQGKGSPIIASSWRNHSAQDTCGAEK